MANLAPSFFIRSSSFLQVTRTTKISRISSIFDRTVYFTLLALDRRNFFPYTLNGRNVVATISPSRLSEILHFFLVTRSTKKSRMSSILNQIRIYTME